jgi:3-oxoadipate enol-lactonase
VREVTVRSGVRIAFADEYFGEPWLAPEVAVLVHGVAESSRAWMQWVPVLAGRLRVIRLDLPGFGASPVPDGYDWTANQFADDLNQFLDVIEAGPAHLIGAKYGGTIALALASRFVDRVLSVSVFSAPVGPPSASRTPDRVRQVGVRQWARESQPARLGAGVTEVQRRWWTDELMGVADERAVLGCTDALRSNPVVDQLGAIRARTLVVTTAGSFLQSVGEAEDYQRLIANSRLEVWPGDYYHPAAVIPQECARRALAWIMSGDNT